MSYRLGLIVKFGLLTIIISGVLIYWMSSQKGGGGDGETCGPERLRSEAENVLVKTGKRRQRGGLVYLFVSSRISCVFYPLLTTYPHHSPRRFFRVCKNYTQTNQHHTQKP